MSAVTNSPLLPSAGVNGPEARLALAESLLGAPDLQSFARQALDWLANNAGVDQTLVAVADPASSNLLLIAERGIPSPVLADFAIPRHDDANPLVVAMERGEPTFFPPAASRETPFSGTAFHALPLRHDDGDHSQGLLIVLASSPEIHGDVLWIARQLSRQPGRLLPRPRLSESGFGQERMLLYSIINAVTDPILLTDTEGKLLVANTHAEKLFAAPEDASEGWRRAVALNNMLFSAASRPAR